jgi:hypothetical protein
MRAPRAGAKRSTYPFDQFTFPVHAELSYSCWRTLNKVRCSEVIAKPKARERLDWRTCASQGSYAKWKIGVDLAKTGHYNARAFEHLCPIR